MLLTEIFVNYYYYYFLKAIDGNYTKWTSWSECSASCDGGVRWRTRNCTNPAPEYGGKDCKELGGSKESEACNTMDCGMYIEH